MNAATVFGGGVVRRDIPQILRVFLAIVVGTILTCFIQMLYIVCIFPWLLKLFEKLDAFACAKQHEWVLVGFCL